MTLFLTSSPFVDGADRAILSNANHFIDRIREALPPFPRCLYVCSSPEDRESTCRYGAETFTAFAEAGIPFSSYNILDAYNADQAESLIAASDFIILCGGHDGRAEEQHRRRQIQRQPSDEGQARTQHGGGGGVLLRGQAAHGGGHAGGHRRDGQHHR